LEEVREDFRLTFLRLTGIEENSDLSIDCFLFLELDFFKDLDLPELALQF